MRGLWIFALLALAVPARTAAAQLRETSWGPTVRFTPFVGVSPNIKQSGDALVVSTAANDVTIHPYDIQLNSSLALGATLELRVWNRFGIIVGGALSSRDGGKLSDHRDDATYEIAGTDLWLVKAGLIMHLVEERPEMQWRRLHASIFAAPALIRDAAKNPLFAPPEAAQTIDHSGLNVGVEAEIPLTNRRFALTLALEDWLIFWNAEEYRPRVGAYVEQRDAAQMVVAVDPERTHLWILRAGLSFRF